MSFGSKAWMALLVAAALVAPSGFVGGGAAMAAAPAPAWIVNKTVSRLRFQSSSGGAPFVGAFERWNADIHFDPKNLAASAVLVRIDMTSARTGANDRDEALPGADWFATAKFAQASFAAKSFKDLGGGRYQALGTLRIRGIARPLTLNFQLAIKGDQARMVGNAVIDRRVFGVGQGQFAGADTVPFAVRIAVAITAKRG